MFEATVTAPAEGARAAASTETLDAVVNDTDYPDHPATGFSVTAEAMTVASVPEPQTGALMLAGVAALGWVARRRAAVA